MGEAARCDNLSTADLVIDGLLDDWSEAVIERVGAPPDGAIALRCSWDGTALALSLDITDDRVVRVRGAGHEDHVDIAISVAGKTTKLSAFPGNPIAKPRIAKPARAQLATSLQTKGFSVELRIPASAVAGLAAASSSVDLAVIFHDSDLAAGGDSFDLPLKTTLELGDRKDLLDDFLRTAKLRRGDLKLDTIADLDPEHPGKERVVAGGSVIGVLAERYAFVTLPVAKASDVRSVELVAIGARGAPVIAAVARQSGNGGTRDVLLLWSVHKGEISPLAAIEVRKQLADKILETTWKVVAGRKGPELWVEPKPAVGWTAETWSEEASSDSDPIVVPWDDKRGGIAYAVQPGGAITRRDLPRSKR